MVIQRTWKILGDSSTTTTESNISPSGFQSSSDDSNCSNQTTHSMVTSVASPPPISKLDTVLAASVEQMKFVTTPNMAETVFQRLRQRFASPTIGNGTTTESAMRSLELLRINVQAAFDTEIDKIVKRFVEDYFKPAFHNIKENLGQNSISDDILYKMSCALLENAKGQYNTIRIKSQSTCIIPNSTTEHSVRLAMKRPATKPVSGGDPSKKIFSIAASTLQSANSECNSSVKTVQSLAQPVMALQNQKAPLNPTPAARRQIFWNTANISITTRFVLDVQANQAFGFGTDGKERLASKHPELIRYLPDSEDRDWLTSQNIIAQQNRNSRFLFLIYDELCKLKQTHHAYRTKSNVDLASMQTFTVPESMIHKMKLFFVDLNIKSRGLITNSFSLGATQGNSHLRNALLQGMQPTANVDSEVSGAPVYNHNAVSSVDVAEGGATVKTKASILSSSHATLTALLNNSTSTFSSIGGITEKFTSTTIRK